MTLLRKTVRRAAPSRPSLVLRRRAAQWLVRLTSGEATADDLEAFRRWRDVSPEHREALWELRHAWVLIAGDVRQGPWGPCDEA